MNPLFTYLESGGFIVWPLFSLAVLLWYGLGYRFSVLQQGAAKKNVRLLIDLYKEQQWPAPKGILEEAIMKAEALKNQNLPELRYHLDEQFRVYQKEFNCYKVLIKTIVYSAPLLGLLGTVGGMIETFDALRSMNMYTQSGGIAGGISKALITTQLGLAVAIPGMVVSGILNKRQTNIEMDLDQIKDIYSSQANAEQVKL